MKKKLIVLGLISTMTFSIVACGSDNNPSNETTTATEMENNETKNNEDDTVDNKTESVDTTDKTDELTDEYLLSLSETSSEMFLYDELSDGSGICIDKYIGEDDVNAITIVPTTIDDKPVKEISSKAFYNVNVKAVVVSGDVEYLGENAFHFSEIEKVLITSPIKEMGNGVFMQSRIKEIVINNAETIGCTCFSSSTIDTIKLSTKTIQDGAFITSKVQKLIIESECVSEGAFLGNKIKVIEFLDGKFTFDDSDNGKFEETLFIAPSGSEVEQYAKDNGLNFEALD